MNKSKVSPINPIIMNIGEKIAEKTDGAFVDSDFVVLTPDALLLKSKYFEQVSGVLYYKGVRIHEISPYTLTQPPIEIAAELYSVLHCRAVRINEGFVESSVNELMTTGHLNVPPITAELVKVVNPGVFTVIIKNGDEVMVVLPIEDLTNKEDLDAIKQAISKIAVKNMLDNNIEATLR